MKSAISFLILSTLLFSCEGSRTGKPETTEQVAEVSANQTADSDSELSEKSKDLVETFEKVSKTYPADSAYLRGFYFERHPAKTAVEMQQQINQMETLLYPETVAKYKEVSVQLKPLLNEILKTSAVTKAQAVKFAYLYSAYDQFSGRALLKGFLSEDENYSLVWRTMEIMVAASKSDTSYISSLIDLDNAISTNVELAEKVGEFVIDAIKNNPTGFLEMYSLRSGKARDELATHAMLWEDPVPEMVSMFEELKLALKDSSMRSAADELVTQISNPL
ncbi:MAG: hypothetical protein RIG68_23250 [Imperialibacter sp.]|uniref:hypothetical protein n=1 Tax=Imperialibacter sp. TaxID=2038411 RepID=UPI0032ED4A57